MSEEKSGGLDMKDLTSTSFGYIIAYSLPGLLGIYGLSYWSDSGRQFLGPAFREANLGPSVIFLLEALGIGLCINALRYLIFERLLYRKPGFPVDMFAKLVFENRLVSFKTVVDEHYRYHQFYGGTALALTILYAGWWWSDHPAWGGRTVSISIGFLALEWLLSDTAMKTYDQYIDRGCTVVNS